MQTMKRNKPIGMLGKKHTPEAIEKIRKTATGRKMSTEMREKMRVIALNRPPVSEETRKKISQARKGKKRQAFSDEWRANISKSLTGLRGKQARNWQGGKAVTGDGYVRIYAPEHPNATNSGYVLEHRLIMEQKLGRLLESNEVVHHINHCKTDNRPDNLLLTNKVEHKRIHRETGESTRVKSGQHISSKTEFKKGNIPWNKGIKSAN